MLTTTSVNDSDDENNVEEEMETILGKIQTQIEKKKFGKRQKKKVLKLLDKLSAIADNCGGKYLPDIIISCKCHTDHKKLNLKWR